MQITSRFTLAIHIMLCVSSFSEKIKVTSTFLAKSANTNPVIIRKILGQLKEAKLVEIKAGVGGAFLLKDPNEITLYDIFYAVHAVDDNFFNFHPNPNCECPVGKNIHTVLDSHLEKIQIAMDNEMKSTTLDTLLKETDEFLVI
ncbi:MAG: Rrf2 family transcriptional regulator [Pleomorphochaeta sp.]